MEHLQNIVGAENVYHDEALKKHTTFRIGGPARYFVTPRYIEDFVETIHYLQTKDYPYLILGNGSNFLFQDEGYSGVVVSTRGTGKTAKVKDKMEIDAINFYETEEEKEILFQRIPELTDAKERFAGKTLVLAGCGIMLSSLAKNVIHKGLKGFAFAGGIPGTLGGAVTMNAGAYGGEIKDQIAGAMLLTDSGEQRFYSKEELLLGYRTSVIQKENLIVLYAVFSFEKGDAVTEEAMMQEFNQRRREKQPLEYGSAGSTFKRPEGYFAGKLIEDAGLKGYRVGDIMVSDKHAGFVVNVGEGTYEQAMAVIAHVKQTVREQFGVELEMEVRTI